MGVRTKIHIWIRHTSNNQMDIARNLSSSVGTYHIQDNEYSNHKIKQKSLRVANW